MVTNYSSLVEPKKFTHVNNSFLEICPRYLAFDVNKIETLVDFPTDDFTE